MLDKKDDFYIRNHINKEYVIYDNGREIIQKYEYPINRPGSECFIDTDRENSYIKFVSGSCCVSENISKELFTFVLERASSDEVIKLWNEAPDRVKTPSTLLIAMNKTCEVCYDDLPKRLIDNKNVALTMMEKYPHTYKCLKNSKLYSDTDVIVTALSNYTYPVGYYKEDSNIDYSDVVGYAIDAGFDYKDRNLSLKILSKNPHYFKELMQRKSAYEKFNNDKELVLTAINTKAEYDTNNNWIISDTTLSINECDCDGFPVEEVTDVDGTVSVYSHDGYLIREYTKKDVGVSQYIDYIKEAFHRASYASNELYNEIRYNVDEIMTYRKSKNLKLKDLSKDLFVYDYYATLIKYVAIEKLLKKFDTQMENHEEMKEYVFDKIEEVKNKVDTIHEEAKVAFNKGELQTSNWKEQQQKIKDDIESYVC